MHKNKLYAAEDRNIMKANEASKQLKVLSSICDWGLNLAVKCLAGTLT
jgi:hypothetical protein